jgi:hypothetical protein
LPFRSASLLPQKLTKDASTITAGHCLCLSRRKLTSPQNKVRRNAQQTKNEVAKKREAANATASSIAAKCWTGVAIVCLESELYDAASPEETTAVDFLVHKPGIGRV